jgi:hypothetical protein
VYVESVSRVLQQSITSSNPVHHPQSSWLWSRLGTIVTTLSAGADEREFTIHQNFLCERSLYLAAATKEHWKQWQEHRVPLPDDDCLAVGMYVQWTYGRKIFSRPSRGQADDKLVCDEHSLLVDAFIFGEKIQDGLFMDAIIDSIIASINVRGKDVRFRYLDFTRYLRQTQP